MESKKNIKKRTKKFIIMLILFIILSNYYIYVSRIKNEIWWSIESLLFFIIVINMFNISLLCLIFILRCEKIDRENEILLLKCLLLDMQNKKDNSNYKCFKLENKNTTTV